VILIFLNPTISLIGISTSQKGFQAVKFILNPESSPIIIFLILQIILQSLSILQHP